MITQWNTQKYWFSPRKTFVYDVLQPSCIRMDFLSLKQESMKWGLYISIKSNYWAAISKVNYFFNSSSITLQISSTPFFKLPLSTFNSRASSIIFSRFIVSTSSSRIIFAQFSNLLHTAYSTCTWVRGVVLNRRRKKEENNNNPNV